MAGMDCPCGTGKKLAQCCGPFIQGKKLPETPELLMRARYTAYVNAEIDYILGTQDPKTSGDVDRESTESWSKKSEWLGFELIDTAMGEDGETGTVDFIARYRLKGEEYAHHEQASFRRDETRWLFVDSKMADHETFKRAEKKVGRNDPCPCGSGKKYKKCCAVA